MTDRQVDNKVIRGFLVAVIFIIASTVASAASVIVNNINLPGEGFNDPTIVAPVTGNPATTLGEQRLAAFQAAADEWGATLVSDVTIVIDAQMTSLFCDQNSATLGSAGPRGNIDRDFPEAPSPGTWYPQALANALIGSDIDPARSDVAANFNQDIGTPGCLESLGWSYVIGVPAPSGSIPFYDTVVHEIGHGLGFLTFVNTASGAQFAGFPDHYSQFLLDETPTPTLWNDMTDAERAASATDDGQLTWAGPETANVSAILSAGRHASSNRVRMYAPTTLSSGSSVSHWDTALTPNEIMEPSLRTPNEKRLTNHLMLDIGWNGSVELAVSIDDGETTLVGGSATSYLITLANNGPSDMTLIDAMVTNTMPAALQNISWTCGGSGGAICSSGAGNSDININVSVPMGGVITFNIDATIDPAFTGTLGNTVSVTMPGNIQNLVSSTDSDDTTVTPGVATPAIIVSAISGDTTEPGGTAFFDVVLNSQPADNVDIGLSSSDPTEGIPSLSGLTFTSANWNSAQVVTVTGVDDDVDDGFAWYLIVTANASSIDPDYDSLNVDDVSVRNLDNDTAGISVTTISGDTTESGSTASFTVVLDSEPLANVSVGISSSDVSEGTPSPASLIFTSANWDTAQVVTVTGIDDALFDGDVAYSIETAAAASADGNYAGLDADDVAVTNLDNEPPVIIFSSGFEPD